MGSILITSLLLISSAFCYEYSIGKNSDSKNILQTRTCKTLGCIKAARLISENMDKSVHPCDNFYRFACGSYIKRSVIQKDRNSVSILGQADDRLKKQLKESIEEKIDKYDSRALRLLKSHYDSCLDVDILDELGGWPVLIGETWDESKFDWKRLIYQLRRIGYRESMQSFISFNIGIDKKNSTQHVIQLDEAVPGLESEYLREGLKNEKVQAYNKYMVNIAEALEANKRRAIKELTGVLRFEIELAKISLPREEARNSSRLYNPMTVAELETDYPDIPWKKYINELLKPYYTIGYTERVIVSDPNYLKAVSELISKTSKRVLANYAIWRVVKESVPFMGEEFLNFEARFMEYFTGTNVQPPRWERCLDYVSNYLPVAVGALYVKKVFNKNIKKEGENLVEDIRQIFQNSLEKVDWMDRQTKMAALKKLKSMGTRVAYPDELLDNEKVNMYFDNFKFVPNSYLGSYLKVSLFKIENSYKQLRKSHNEMEWATDAYTAVVNAFYNFLKNDLEIPAGQFQEEFFAIDRPNYVNYGGIGSVIGHEFTHGFDDEGSQYDENGNLVNWWDHKTQREYQKRTQCIVDQYSNYTVAEVGLKINGVTSQGENIADNGGTKQAYLAYEEYEIRNGPEPRLPGLPYSPRQLFWLSHANTYCEKYRPEALKSAITLDGHSPGEFRVIGTFSNIPEFSRDFECPLGSPMNPVMKCTVW